MRWIFHGNCTSFSAFTKNLDNGINNFTKFVHEKVGRTASILDGKQNSTITNWKVVDTGKKDTNQAGIYVKHCNNSQFNDLGQEMAGKVTALRRGEGRRYQAKASQNNAIMKRETCQGCMNRIISCGFQDTICPFQLALITPRMR